MTKLNAIQWLTFISPWCCLGTCWTWSKFSEHKIDYFILFLSNKVIRCNPKKEEEENKTDNHVYEQRFKPFRITSACLNLLYRSIWLSAGPAWLCHIIYFNTTIWSHWTESKNREDYRSVWKLVPLKHG